MKTPQEILNSFYLEGKITEEHSKEIITAIKEYGAQCEQEGRDKAVDYIKNHGFQQQQEGLQCFVVAGISVLDSARQVTK